MRTKRTKHLSLFLIKMINVLINIIFNKNNVTFVLNRYYFNFCISKKLKIPIHLYELTFKEISEI